jgi:hypothetical protein
VVYNHKRHGEFSLGGRKFAFRVKPSFPKTLTKEFLLVAKEKGIDPALVEKDYCILHCRECMF